MIRILGQVSYINDSKATNCEAATKAIACHQNIHWIAGGQLNEDTFSCLKTHLAQIQHAYLIGEATDRLAAELEGKVKITISKSLENAVRQAHENAQFENCSAVVLLSPACASFDQFANFEARGDGFREAVESLV